MSPQSSYHHQKGEDSKASCSNSPRAEQSSTPQPGPERLSYFAATIGSSSPYISPYARKTETRAEIPTVTVPQSQNSAPKPSTSLNPELQDLSFTDYPGQESMSAYSSSSANSSIYDSPNPQKYRGTIGMLSNSKQISTVSICSTSAKSRR